jgi:hypothetical protein
MKDLAYTAGDFAVRLAETCSTLPTVTVGVENLLQQFNRWVSINYGVYRRLNFYGKTTAPYCRRVRGLESKTVDVMLPPEFPV